jgi:co-chaperonin GroES (HSP10)
MVVQIETLPIVPARGYLVCEPLKETVTKGGIALPEMHEDSEDSYRPKKIRVLEVAAPKLHRDTGEELPPPLEVAVGDVVIAGGPGFCWDFDGRTLWLVDADMIVCKVVDTD